MIPHRRRRPLGRALALVALGLVLVVGGVTGGAAAQQPAPDDESIELGPPAPAPEVPKRLALRRVDGTDPGAVELDFLYTGDRVDVTELFIRENGVVVAATPPARIQDQPYGVAIVVDSSLSMQTDATFERAVDAVRTLVDNKPADEQMAVLGVNDEVQVLARATTNAATLQRAIDDLGVGEGDAIVEAVLEAVNLLDRDEVRPLVLVITDGGDDSVVELDAVQAVVDDAGALVLAVGVDNGDLDTGLLDDLVAPSGGVAVSTADPRTLTEVLTSLRAAGGQQFRVTFESVATLAEPTDVQLTVGDQVVTGTYTPAVAQESPFSVREITPAEPGGFDALQGRPFLFVALALILLAVSAAVYTLVSVFVTERRSLDSALQPYADGFVAGRDDDERSGIFGTNAMLARAVNVTGRFVERQGVLQRSEVALERADLPLRAAEGLFLYAAFTAVVAVVSLLLTRNPILTLIIAVIAALIPPAAVSYRAGRRRRQFNEQLPDMLTLLAGTLRAGYSLMQGMEAAAQEVTEPMRKELQRVVTESRLGMPLETSMEAVAVRMGSADFEWAVMAIGIQREVGGNLAELLLTVAETMTQRERLRRDVKSLTAEGRISAFVLGGLPPILGFVMYAINPDYMTTLFDETAGNIALGGGLVLMLVGFYWMYKTIDIEV